MKKIIYVVLIISSVLFLTACSSSATPITETDFLMDTYVSITVYNTEDSKLLDDAFNKCKEYNDILSKTSDSGDISALENNRGKYIEVSEHTINVINIYKDLYDISEGMLDCTIGKLTNLWNFGDNSEVIPKTDDINVAIESINFDNVSVIDNTVSLNSDNAQLDFGAVAKGYISDKIKEFLIENGVESAILNFGGNVVTIGSKPDGSIYNVGIQMPYEGNEEIITSVSIKDKAVITAGVYERYIDSGDKNYHHILNPFTGYSAETDLLSASIICDDAAIGDAYSTICILLGKDKAMELINNTNELEAIFVDNNREIILSDGASEYINKE